MTTFFSFLFFVLCAFQVSIQEVLDAKHAFRWVDPVIRKDATVREAILTCIEGGLSGMLVVETAPEGHHRRVTGLLTSRDLLRIIAAAIKEDENMHSEDIFGRKVDDFMTPISQVIYARPHESVGMCRTLMAKLGIKCLPILDKEGRVEGLITARDMNDFGLSASDKGGKKSYLNDISQRVGLSSDTSMAEPPTYMHAHLALEQSPLFINLGVHELPHPWKTAESVGFSQRGELQLKIHQSKIQTQIHVCQCLNRMFVSTYFFYTPL
jgi:CBS domain-containing protein